jgi:hypothetical protein
MCLRVICASAIYASANCASAILDCASSAHLPTAHQPFSTARHLRICQLRISHYRLRVICAYYTNRASCK